MAFAPFDGLLLEDPRDLVPGAVAITLHYQVERALAARDRRPPLPATALRHRAAACRALLGQGLLPRQLRALESCGFALGAVGDVRSPASLVRHLEAYLQAVEAHGWVEGPEALWRAAGEHAAGGRGFWVERRPEDGPLEAGLRDLEPPRLRALCALSELGGVRFRLATRRGSGHRGLFADREPHLVRQLLPALESLAGEQDLAHLELEVPEGWGENPWGEALDRLFEGPLALDAGGRRVLQRRLLPTEAAVWRGAVEQIRAWVDEGIAPSGITVVHPDPAGIGPLLAPLLAAEGIALRGHPGGPLRNEPVWGPLWSLLTGLRDADPSRLAEGLADPAPTPLGRALRGLSARLAKVDQTGAAPMHEAAAAQSDQAWIRDRWRFLWSLREKRQAPAAWLTDVEALALRLDLGGSGETLHPVLGLLGDAWASEGALFSFAEFMEGLDHALEALRAASRPGDPEGVRLLAPPSLESDWEGGKATLLLDLGEGAWPAAPAPNPELDWSRLEALNRALRRQQGGPEDFPPRLQTFALPQAEEGEVLPRAFHRDAYRFNRALALTQGRFVALSAERDAEGQRRAQGPFWHALDGAGLWRPSEESAASRLRWRWEAGEADGLTLARQRSTAGIGEVPEPDLVPGRWVPGGSPDAPLAPTLLESLARCPFRVFAERELGLGSREEMDPHVLRLGSLAHKLLEAALRGQVGRGPWPGAFLEDHGLSSPAVPAILALLKSLWRSEGDRWLAGRGSLSRSEVDRLTLALEELLPAMAEVLSEDLGREAPFPEELAHLGLPQEAEWRRELAGVELRLDPRALDLPGGGRVWVHGALDRLERWSSGAGTFLRIVDYKTSRPETLRTYRDGEGALGAHLQLPLYQAMVEEAQGLPATALLVSLREAGRPVAMMLDGERQALLRVRIEAMLDRARAGDFPVRSGEHCAGCGLAALCGRPVDLEPSSEVAP